LRSCAKNAKEWRKKPLADRGKSAQVVGDEEVVSKQPSVVNAERVGVRECRIKSCAAVRIGRLTLPTIAGTKYVVNYYRRGNSNGCGNDHYDGRRFRSRGPHVRVALDGSRPRQSTPNVRLPKSKPQVFRGSTQDQQPFNIKNLVVEHELEKDVNRLRSAVVLVAIFATAGCARAQEFKQRFVGKSPCAADIQSESSDFSLRLDKDQDLTLLYRDLSAVKVVMIVEPNGSGDHCGVIRDVVQITRVAKGFEFRCFDSHKPRDVIVGTGIRNGNIKPITAIDAWRIDLKEKKFVETHDRVTCTAEGWGGEDDGGNLVDEAKKYAAHHKSGQFESDLGNSQGTPLVQVRIEGDLQKAKAIERVLPKYPEEALKRRITGSIELHVVFDRSGTVRLAEVISGHPVFAQASLDAAKHWKYPPTMVYGKPVEVDTLVFVTFSFSGR